MEYVSPETLLEIDDKKVLLYDNLDLSRKVMEAFEQEANCHSDMIEHPGRIKRRELRKILKQKNGITLKNLTNAWDWANKNFDGYLSREFVEELAGLVEPQTPTAYRRDNVRITGDDAVLPPQWVKVPEMMGQLFKEANNYNLHPVNRAVYTHLHMCRIHPFIDGNGRAARLLQNLILNSRDYPPATVRIEERRFYQELLRRALNGYRERTSDGNKHKIISAGEKSFFEYLASRVNIELASVETRLSKLPEYELALEHVKDKGQIYTVKRILDAYFRQGSHIGQVRITNPQSGICRIVGDICPDNIIALMEKTNALSRIGYNVKRVNRK